MNTDSDTRCLLDAVHQLHRVDLAKHQTEVRVGRRRRGVSDSIPHGLEKTTYLSSPLAPPALINPSQTPRDDLARVKNDQVLREEGLQEAEGGTELGVAAGGNNSVSTSKDSGGNKRQGK